jgi:hypothetical protein
MECLKALQNRAPIETKSEDDIAAEAKASEAPIAEAKVEAKKAAPKKPVAKKKDA